MPNKRKGNEFPPKSGIIISPKTNPSGSKAYRVDIAASITGSSREQRQFPTRETAQEYARKRHLEVTRFGQAAFSLTARQREDAARAIEILKDLNLNLEEAAKLAVKHTPIIHGQTSVKELRRRFLAAPGRRKSKLMQRRPLTLHNLTWRSARFEKEHGNRMVTEICTEQVRGWLTSLGELSPVSLNNYRRVLHAMFAYAVAEGYCAANPIAKVPLFAVPERTPSILTVEQAKRLATVAAETDAKLGLLSYVSLSLFAGLRRAEIERLDWSAVKWDRRMITIDGNIAKTGCIRNVALADNALRWLELCQTKTGLVAPPNLNHRLRRLRFLAGITHWDGNELRHSFASYHFDMYQNAPMTAAQLGHSSGCQLLFEHYRSLVPLGDGARFFSIIPDSSQSTVTAIAAT